MSKLKLIKEWLKTHSEGFEGISNLLLAKNNHSKKTCQCRKVTEIEVVEGIENIFTEAYDNPACFDIMASESSTIPPRQYKTIRTGVRMNIPNTHWIKIHSRSGWAAKYGIEAGAGVIDSSYTGGIMVVLHNHSDSPFVIEKGYRIAQFEVKKKENVKLVKGYELKATVRGDNGFGSSGK